MANKAFPIAEQTTGTLDNVDTRTLTNGGNTVLRQSVVISDPATPAADAEVTNTTPGASDYGMVVRTLLPKGTKSTVAAVSVGTTATSIIAANTARKSLLIVNNGSVPVYLGLSGVTTSAGLPLAAGASITDVETTDVWYGIVASGTCDIRVIEVS